MNKINKKPLDTEKFSEILRICTSEGVSRKTILKFAKRIAQTGNPYQICDFCEYVDTADDPEIMPILQSAMEEIGDIVHIYEYAYLMADCGRKYVNYQSLQRLIVLSKNPKLVAYSSEYVPTFDKRELAKGMIEFGNEKWLEHYIEANGFFSGVEDASEEERQLQKQQLLRRLEIAKRLGNKLLPPKSVTAVYGMFVDYDYMCQDVLTSGNPYLINETAEIFEANLYSVSSGEIKEKNLFRVPFHRDRKTYEERIEEYQDAIEKTDDILHIYEFGASVPGANVTRTEDSAIHSRMAKYMFYVGAYVPGSNAQRMLKAIKATGNEKYIKKMEEHMAEVGNPEAC